MLYLVNWWKEGILFFTGSNFLEQKKHIYQNVAYYACKLF